MKTFVRYAWSRNLRWIRASRNKTFVSIERKNFRRFFLNRQFCVKTVVFPSDFFKLINLCENRCPFSRMSRSTSTTCPRTTTGRTSPGTTSPPTGSGRRMRGEEAPPPGEERGTCTWQPEVMEWAGLLFNLLLIFSCYDFLSCCLITFAEQSGR